MDEREKVLVLQFGQIKQVVEEPGLGFKVPIIQDVVRYDDRILSLDTDTIEVTPSDDRRLVVDAFARYRIEDVVQFRQAVGLGGAPRRRGPPVSILNAQIREVLGADQVTSDTILSEDRRDLTLRIREAGAHQADSLGLDDRRCAAQADQPAEPEPRRHLRPDAGGTRTRSGGRDRPR